jgi:hypothetical protein
MSGDVQARYEAALQDIHALKEENRKLQETMCLMKQVESLMKQIESAKEAAVAQQIECLEKENTVLQCQLELCMQK